MSLRLDQGTKPPNLEVKVWGMGSMANTIYLGEYEISLPDFLAAAMYVLTNTDLDQNDPRLQFLRSVRSMNEVDGYNRGRKRLAVSDSASIPTPS